MSDISSLGDVREKELYEALIRRFGRNCVYHSPKIHVHGQEKELGDVVVLALPYMIVFQAKWKQMTSDDLNSEKGEVYRKRLIKTLQEAAGQFKELAVSLRQKMSVGLPQVWIPNSNDMYQFPLDLVAHVVPVVVVDFNDKKYDDPEERFGDIPPVVTEVPAQIKSWGIVHSFLLRDFYRILDQLFTVGDLLYWLQERERLIAGKKRAIIGYGELTLFAIYLTNYPLWQKLFEADCALITDSDCFERATKDWSKDFVKRQEIFGQRSFLDAIDDTMVRSLSMVEGVDRNEAILSYLSCQGRLLCCTAKTKRMMSQKFNSHLHSFRKNGKAFCGSFAISSEPMPLMETAFYLGVAPYDSEEDALEYCARAYGRTLAVLRDHGLDKTTDEVLVLFVQSETHQVFCLLRRVGSMDYSFAPDEEIVNQEMYSQAKQKMNLSEWDVVHGRRDV